MNWINRFFLATVLLPRGIYRRWGVDIAQLTAMLSTKLLMDDRRPNALQLGRSRQAEGETTFATVRIMFISTLMGFMYLFAFIVGSDYVTHLTFYYCMFMAMLSMMLVSDFTSVLIDVRDNYVILPKPVNDATVVVARLLHVFIHICKLVLPMLLPAFVYLTVKTNLLGSLIFSGLTVFATLFCIFLINAVYIAILRITTPERFKNIISYIQIVFAVLIYGTFQILPRMVQNDMMTEFSLAGRALYLILPPYWFAEAFQLLFLREAGMLEIAGALLAFVVPVLSLYVVIRYLAPAFNQKLAMLSGGESVPAAPAAGSPVPKSAEGLGGLLARLLTRDPAERTGFLFTWKMMARSREFKVRVYPSLGYMVVIMVITFVPKLKDLNMDFRQVFSGFKFILIIYMSSLILVAALGQMMYSEKYRASWLFLVPPLERPGPLVNGAVKAVLGQFFGVLALVVIVFGTLLQGPGFLPNLLLALCNQLLLVYLLSTFNYKQLPFSTPVEQIQKGDQFGRSFLLLIVSGIAAGVHYFVFKSILATSICLVVSAGVVAVLMWQLRSMSWLELRRYDD